MSLEGRAFLKLLDIEVTSGLSRLPNVAEVWESPRGWTTFMLGSGATRQAGDHGVLGRIAVSLGYKLQEEYLRVDQIWYWHADGVEDDWHIDVFVEHENDENNLAETVKKCLQIASGLKVIITYSEKLSDAQLREIARNVVKNRYGVPPDARLLLVLGALEGKVVRWKGFEIDGLGREIAIG